MRQFSRKSYSAGGIVINRKRGVLVVRSKISWTFPKGHIEPEETTYNAAVREIAEESGVSRLHKLADLGSYKRPAGNDELELKTITMYLFETDQEHLEPSDPDNPEAKWLDPLKVPKKLTHPGDRSFYESVFSRVKHALENPK